MKAEAENKIEKIFSHLWGIESVESGKKEVVDEQEN